MSEVNFDIASDEYTKWNSVFPNEAFKRMINAGVNLKGVQALDLGCGSGVACRILSQLGANVIGIDPSSELIQDAKNALNADTPTKIEYIVSGAEEVPVADSSIDVVTAVRAWHWFDRERVISEIKRVSKPGSWLVVMDSVFLLKKSAVASRTGESIREIKGGGTLTAGSKASTNQFRNGFPLSWYTEWEEAGFEFADEWTFEYDVQFTHEGWRGRVQSLSSVLSLPSDKKEELDARLAEMLNEEFPDEPLIVPHECRGVVWRI